MKRYRMITAAILVCCILMTTACSPILDHLNPFDVELDYEQPKKREQKTPEMEIDKQVQQIIEQEERDKYDKVDGTDAYYLLPTGTALPSGLVDFQSFGFLDDKTTCYAYQALYALPDETGFGGMPMQGQADAAKSAEVSEQSAHQMVTMLLLYQVETKRYQVLYHNLEEVVVSYVETLDDAQNGTRHLRVSKASALPAGKKATDKLSEQEVADLPLCEKIYTQILGDGSFLFYYDGCGYMFDQNGNLKIRYNLRNYLQNITYAYGPSGYMYGKYGDDELESRPWEKAGDIYTISDMVVDEHGYFYIRLCMSKKEIHSDDVENMTDPDKDMTQLYCRVFSVDVGSSQEQDAQLENAFYSQNLNYQSEVDAWMRVDGQVLSFDEEPTEEMIEEAAGTQESIMQEYPAQFDEFTFCRNNFPVRLELEKIQNDGGEIAPVGIGMTPQLLSWYLQEVHKAVSERGETYAREHYGRNFFVSLPKSSSEREERERFALENPAIPDRPDPRMQEQVRTFTIEYPVTETDEEGNEQETTVQEERTEKASFIERMETRFPEGTNVLYSRETVRDCSLAATAGNGVLEYTQSYFDIKNDKQNGYETEIQWKMGSTEPRSERDEIGISSKMKTAVIPDLAKRLLLLNAQNQEDAPPLLFMSGEHGIYFSDTTAGSSLQEDWVIKGIPYEEMTKQTQSLGSDFYYDASRAVRVKRKNRDWIYLASPTDGILKINTTLGDQPDELRMSAEKAGRVSQISSYPCFGIRIDENGTMCQAIGFPTNDYIYNENDQFRAKVYTVSLEDADAQLNQLSFVFDQNDLLKRTFLNEALERESSASTLPAFRQVLQNLAFEETEASHIKSYQEYLTREVDKKMEARREIGRLSGILNESNRDTFPRYVFEAYHTMLRELKSPEDVEELFISLRMAKDALEGKASGDRQTVLQNVKKEVGGNLSFAVWPQILDAMKALYWPDGSYQAFEEAYFKQIKNKKIPKNEIRLSDGTSIAGAGNESVSYAWVYRNYSKNCSENEMVAAYVSSDETIQQRIVNGDITVWKEIYEVCGIDKEVIEERNKKENPQFWSVQEYETYMKGKALKWRAARQRLLGYLGLSQLPEKQTFFSNLLEEDFSMKEKNCGTAAAVEAWILSLCRQWSQNTEIQGKSDYDLIKFLRENQGYSRDDWDRKMEELARNLQWNCTRSGYDQRETYEVRKAADQMEIDWNEAQTEKKNVISAGQRLLESFRNSASQEESQKAWKLFLLSVGLEADSKGGLLEAYQDYLKKEVSDREQVKNRLVELVGGKVAQNTDLEQRYDSCQTVSDVEALLAKLYTERQEMQGNFAGNRKETLTVEEMVERMQQENHLTKAQWQTKMEQILEQIHIEVSYAAFIAYQQKQNEP